MTNEEQELLASFLERRLELMTGEKMPVVFAHDQRERIVVMVESESNHGFTWHIPKGTDVATAREVLVQLAQFIFFANCYTKSG